MSIFALSLLVAIFLILVFPFENYMTGNSVTVMYSWDNHSTVKIKPVIGSSIPHSYSLYLYSVAPERDEETNTYLVPQETEWTFTGSFKGPGYIPSWHTELFKAVCLKTGTDPKTVIVEHNGSFDTTQVDSLIVEIECH